MGRPVISRRGRPPAQAEHGGSGPIRTAPEGPVGCHRLGLRLRPHPDRVDDVERALHAGGVGRQHRGPGRSGLTGSDDGPPARRRFRSARRSTRPRPTPSHPGAARTPGPAGRRRAMDSRQRRRSHATDSNTARASSAGPCSGRRPTNPAVASSRHHGARAPSSHGVATTPPAPGRHRRASSASSSGVRPVRRPSQATMDPAEESPPSSSQPSSADLDSTSPPRGPSGRLDRPESTRWPSCPN